MGTSASYRNSARPRSAARSPRALMVTKTQYTVKIWCGCPALTLVQGGSFLLWSFSEPWHSLQWHLQASKTCSSNLKPPMASLPSQILCIPERIQKKKKENLRITIYTRILNWWLQQVISTLLCSEIQIFIFIAFKYIVLSQYSTSRVFTVNSESIKAPH